MVAIEVIEPKFNLEKYVWLVMTCDEMPRKAREAKIKHILLRAYEQGKSEVKEGWEMR